MATTGGTMLIASLLMRTANAASVASQGGILEGSNPSAYNPKDPITLFIIQAGIIIIFCRILHWPLSKLRQPRVIAEVIGGILLGPSVMGRIPGFSNAIFPTAAMPNLTLVANLGLVLFLFLVGLEVDMRYLVSNWRVAVSVGLAGMALPFGLGAAIAWGLYHQFRGEEVTPISFGVYMLFIGVAMAITAFPVLCRILTELKLLRTPVGIIVLSAGVGNDVVGWVLLALCVALVNAGTGITALYVLLTAVAWVLFLVFAVRPAFLWVLRRTRSLEDGPSQSVIALTLLIALASAFFTGIIGVHPIFGAFLAGLICPHEGGFAIKVTEKIEDLVSALLLPLYFALSGLSTNIGLLNNGITWAYVVGVIAVAFCAKFGGATIAARLNGLLWRECFAIGSLMSCKGLVELIVLNIGLSAKILSQRTFTIFVVMALVTTFVTTPLTAAFYPEWYQRKIEAWKRGEIDWDTGKPTDGTENASAADSIHAEKMDSLKIQKVLIYLRLDNMPSILAFMSLLGGRPQLTSGKTHPTHAAQRTDEDAVQEYKRPIEAHGVRLIELTERDSSVMQVSEVDEYSSFDPVVNSFRTIGQLTNVAASGEVTVVPESSFANALTGRAIDEFSDLILLPWSETGSMSETHVISSDAVRNKFSSSTYTNFVANALSNAPCTTAVFINNKFGGSGPKARNGLSRTLSALSISSQRDKMRSTPVSDRSHHMFFPFFGGADDRVALRLVLQMAENAEVTVTIVHFETPIDVFEELQPTVSSPTPTTPTSKKLTTTISAPPGERDAAFFASMRNSLAAELSSRVTFSTQQTSTPTADAIERAAAEVGQSPRNAGDLLVLGRNAGLREAFLKSVDGQGANVEASKCLGVVAETAVRGNVKASVLVVQAKADRQ